MRKKLPRKKISIATELSTALQKHCNAACNAIEQKHRNTGCNNNCNTAVTTNPIGLLNESVSIQLAQF